MLKTAEEIKNQISKAMSVESIKLPEVVNSLGSANIPLKQEQIEFLMKSLKSPRKVELIFRASEHSFSAAAFHQKCDNKADTLTLIRTQFGKTIGAYSHYEWKSEGGWLSDSGRRACIFSLDMMEKFVPQGADYLIYRHKDYGPRFGGGADICISDGCNNNNDSYAGFPSTYNR